MSEKNMVKVERVLLILQLSGWTKGIFGVDSKVRNSLIFNLHNFIETSILSTEDVENVLSQINISAKNVFDLNFSSSSLFGSSISKLLFVGKLETQLSVKDKYNRGN